MEKAAAASSSAGDKSDNLSLPGPFGVKLDDHENDIDVILVIKGIRRPKLFGIGKNTTVDLKLTENSLTVYVEVLRKGKHGPVDKTRYAVRKLPAAILPHLCTYRLRSDQLLLQLVKSQPGSWTNILDQVGLETAPDEDEQQERH